MEDKFLDVVIFICFPSEGVILVMILPIVDIIMVVVPHAKTFAVNNEDSTESVNFVPLRPTYNLSGRAGLSSTFSPIRLLTKLGTSR